MRRNGEQRTEAKQVRHGLKQEHSITNKEEDKRGAVQEEAGDVLSKN